MEITRRKNTTTRSENRKVVKYMSSLCKQELVKRSPFYPRVMRVTEQHRTVVVLSVTPVNDTKYRSWKTQRNV